MQLLGKPHPHPTLPLKGRAYCGEPFETRAFKRSACCDKRFEARRFRRRAYCGEPFETSAFKRSAGCDKRFEARGFKGRAYCGEPFETLPFKGRAWEGMGFAPEFTPPHVAHPRACAVAMRTVFPRISAAYTVAEMPSPANQA